VKKKNSEAPIYALARILESWVVWIGNLSI